MVFKNCWKTSASAAVAHTFLRFPVGEEQSIVQFLRIFKLYVFFKTSEIRFIEPIRMTTRDFTTIRPHKGNLVSSKC